MPANSGRLTVEEFAENFNQMAQATDSPLRLHSNGAWVRDSLRGYAATLENAFPSRLKYETDANGYLTAVRFRCSYTAQGGGDPSFAPTSSMPALPLSSRCYCHAGQPGRLCPGYGGPGQ